MKTDKNNIHAGVEAVVKNLFDPTNNVYIRDNYKRTLMNIRDYCDDAVKFYDKKQAQEELAKPKKRKIV